MSRLFRTTALVVLLFAAAPLAAQETLRETTSLGFVPGDTPFYAAWLRNQEQFEALVRSRAFRKLAELPIVAEVRKSFLEGFQGGFDQKAEEEGTESFAQWASQPENAELLLLLGDVMSQEVFLLGDASFDELRRKLAADTQQLQALSGQGGEELTEEMIAGIEKLVKDLDAPNFLFGFKLRDTKRAERQLARLEAVLKKGIDLPAMEAEQEAAELGETDPDAPAVAEVPRRLSFDRLKSIDLNGGRFLHLPLDGNQVPWDEVQGEEMTDQQRALFERVVPILRRKTLTINLGVWRSYLLLSIGADSRAIETLGKGKPLYDHPQLALLRKHADRRVTRIGFISDDFVRAAAPVADDDAGIFAQYARQIEAAEQIPEKLKKAFLEDLKQLQSDLKKFETKPGGSLSFSFLTDRGHESFAVDWSENRALDPSKKLTILSHLGEKPIYVSASRSKSSLEGWKVFAKWVARTDYYLRTFVAPELGPDEEDSLETFLDEVGPLLRRFDTATQELFYPALADGQSALVVGSGKSIDPKAIEIQSNKPLPVLLPALVYGVSDAQKLKDSLAEYQAVIDGLTAYAKEKSPFALYAQAAESMAEQQSEQLPKVETVSEGGVDYKTLRPAQFPGVDDFSPTASLSKSIATLTLTRGHAARLQKTTPVVLEGPAGNLNRPLGAVSYLDFVRLFDVGRDWFEAINENHDQPAVALNDPDDPEPDMIEIRATPEEWEKNVQIVRTVFDVLRCIKGFSSVTYQDGKTLVRHTEWRYADLPE